MSDQIVAAPAVVAAGRRSLDPVHQAIVAERKALVTGKPGRPPKLPTRDLAVAFQYGKLNALAPALMARAEKALADPTDPLHEMVVKQLLMRVAPVAFWEALAKQEFKPEEERNVRPSINIFINGQAGVQAAEPADADTFEG